MPILATQRRPNRSKSLRFFLHQVRDRGAMEKAMQEAADQLGGINILVANAGRRAASCIAHASCTAGWSAATQLTCNPACLPCHRPGILGKLQPAHHILAVVLQHKLRPALCSISFPLRQVSWASCSPRTRLRQRCFRTWWRPTCWECELPLTV